MGVTHNGASYQDASYTRRKRLLQGQVGMRASFLSVLTFALCACVPLRLAHGAAASAPTTFRLASDPAFAHYRAPLLAYLRRHHAPPDWQVCILGEQGADGTRWAWVIWPHEQRMILWGGGTSTLIDSRRILDLTTDVVASEDQLHGSSYLVTRAWVAQQVSRCHRSGLMVSPATLQPGH